MKAAVDDAVARFNSAVKPVIIAGSKARACKACTELEQLSTKTGYDLAAMPDAKGFVSEEQERYIGVYWGPIESLQNFV